MQKFFERLSGASPLQANQKEMEICSQNIAGHVPQCAKYIHGVGDSTNLLIKVADGSTGAGLLTRLVRGFTYISRVYEEGDHIFLIGFSRGAYTARALGGLIAKQGLLDWRGMELGNSNDAKAYAAGMMAWSRYRKASDMASSPGFVEMMDNLVTAAKADILSEMACEFNLILRPNIKLTAIGVWETVGALGIPIYAQGDSTRLDLFQFVDQNLSPAVTYGFHALAIDEERVDFTPTFWNRRSGVIQVLFPGAHSDVGGGYPASNPAITSFESGLSDGALKWMLDKMSSIGVLVKPYNDIHPNPRGVLHRPWLQLPYSMRSQQLRHFDHNEYRFALSESVLERCAAGPTVVEAARDSLYRPDNLINYLDPGMCCPGPEIEVSGKETTLPPLLP